MHTDEVVYFGIKVHKRPSEKRERERGGESIQARDPWLHQTMKRNKNDVIM